MSLVPDSCEKQTANAHTDARIAMILHERIERLDAAFAEGKVNDELRRTNPAAFKVKMEAMLPEKTCCFCRDTFRGYGHNPRPLLEEGVACDVCNYGIVINARYKAAHKS